MPRRPSGFTLIELMVAVAIVGLLSSVAIPTYQNFQLRSRQTERTLLLEVIHRGIEDYYARESRFPQDWGGGLSYLGLMNANPDWSPTSQKRAWRQVALGAGDDWNKLSLAIEGNVYYTYYGWGIVEPVGGTLRYYLLWAVGDLDGDRNQNTLERDYEFLDNQLLRFAGAPPNGKVSFEQETGGKF